LFKEVAKKLVSKIKSMVLVDVRSALNTTQPRALWTLLKTEIKIQTGKLEREQRLFEKMRPKKQPIKINQKRVLIIKENKNSF
jgi:hypothetical protein